MICLQRTGHVESRGAHPKGSKDQVLHGFIVGRAQITFRIVEMRADVAGGGRHQITVLENFTEAACRLHGAEQGQGAFRRGVLEFENPLEVLARKAGAGANEMLHENFACYVGITELERWIRFRSEEHTSELQSP